MTIWEERLEKHPIHSTINSCNEILTNINWFSDTEANERLVRIKHILTLIQSKLDDFDPVLGNIYALNKTNEKLSEIYTQLNSFLADNDIQHLNAANESIDTTLTYISTLSIPTSQNNIKSLTDISEEFGKQVNNVINEFQTTTDNFSNEISSISNKASQISTELNTLSSDIKSERQNLTALASEFQKQFSESEDRRRKDFETSLQQKTSEITSLQKDLDTKVKEVIKIGESQMDDKVTNLNQKSVDTIEFLEDKKKEASKIVRIISNIGVTGNFSRTADSYGKWSIALRIVALAFMTGIALGAVYTVVLAIKEGFDWKVTLFRIFTILTLAIPGFYAAREAEKYRRGEQRYRNMELELASIDPYIESLPEEMRNGLKEELAKRLFAKSEIEVYKDDQVTEKSLFSLLERLINQIMKKM